MKKIFICLIAIVTSISTSAFIANHHNPTETESGQVVIYKECKTCNGKGYMTIRKKCTCLGNPECTKCGGDGIIEIKSKCNTCGGTGKIRVN